MKATEDTNATAHEVAIAGSFNRWDSESTRMVHVGRGRWLRVVFVAPRRFEYRLIVDGCCTADHPATRPVRYPSASRRH